MVEYFEALGTLSPYLLFTVEKVWNLISPELIGIVGAGTGSLSLILYFFEVRKNRPDIKLDRFGEAGYQYISNEFAQQEKSLYIGLRLKNKGILPTTIENVCLTFNGRLKEDGNLKFYLNDKHNIKIEPLKVPFDLTGNKSKIFRLEIALDSEDEKTILSDKKSICKICIEHTFGKVEITAEI
ncbi:MAG: hypothetical protein HZC29_00740 [Thaumarchaeota archaeon]|nr:hypothetical protein [Nitrososphaerota archaeon]